MLSQKQKLLTASIEQTTEKLNRLKAIQEEYISQGKDLNTENYRALTREIEKTTQKLSDLKNQASVFQKIGTELEGLGKKFQATGKEIDELGSKLTTRLSAPITALIGAGVGYNAQIETYQKTLERFVGSSEKAADFIDEIKKNAAKSPFDVKSLIQANQMLLAAGENAGESSKLINALGDSIAATGGGNDELVRMASNLQQVKNARKSNNYGP
jgi:phage-related minor tail protein